MEKKKITEELNRYKTINSYMTKMIMEQEVPVEPDALPPVPNVDAQGLPTGDLTPQVDTPQPPQEEEEEPDVTPELAEPSSDDTTEEIDITDLVNMTKNIKKELESSKSDNSGVDNKMNDIFSKLNDLESKLSQMDNVIQKIDQLGTQIQQIRPQTPVERLEMRSLDSYPFNQKPVDFFNQKQEEMKLTGKNEYVLTKDDVDNYSKRQISTSFNPFGYDQEFNAIKQ